MKMNEKYLLYLCIIFQFLMFSCDEFGSKSEYAVLQQTEFEYKEK